MNTSARGQQAESMVANYLANRGFEVLHRNWRTRHCEIDIVAQFENCIYFVEVKYRRNRRQGSGLENITPAKLKQMGFAAQFWVARQGWRGGYRLAAAEVSGEPAIISRLVLL